MDRVLIKTYNIPANVSKQLSKYTSLELYSDCLVGKGNKMGDVTYFFKNYIDIKWTPASLITQYAQVVFITHENASNYVSASGLASFNDANKIPFCSGMYSYKAANEYARDLCMEIKEVMTKYQEENSKHETTTINAALSPADELKKFKELLDMGIITQEEFDAKKKQILGL